MPNTLPFKASFKLALSGDGAPERAHYDRALLEARTALADLLQAPEKLELLTISDRRDDLSAAAEVAQKFADASAIFVLGIGGSSLGGEALSALLSHEGPRAPRVRFFGNLDGNTFGAALRACDPKTTRFVAISKSGGTAETLMQTLTAAAAIREAGGKHLANYFAVVTENKKSALRKFAEDIGCPILDHPLGIGGRYSVLSVVGLFPAMLMGLDARQVRDGAKSVIDAARADPDAEESPAAGAALHLALLRGRGLRETVLWSYSDRLGTFGAWWRQLWAESLGKGGQGTTPVAAVGPVDQHSQLQLFLDGPGGVLFTLLSLDTQGEGPRVPAEEAEKYGLSYLAGETLGGLVAAEARATAETLARRGRPVRRIQLGKLDERALGALFMHFMLETILMGRLTGVDPFDQPAVEEGKILAREYLEGR